jgi:hypothetical protein
MGLMEEANKFVCEINKFAKTGVAIKNISYNSLFLTGTPENYPSYLTMRSCLLGTEIYSVC